MQPVDKANDGTVFNRADTDSMPDRKPESAFETGTASGREADVGSGIEAEFVLEAAAVCPQCREDINRVQVVRMLRTKVNFVSSLPRRGQLLVCPKCRTTLGGSLGGLI